MLDVGCGVFLQFEYLGKTSPLSFPLDISNQLPMFWAIIVPATKFAFISFLMNIVIPKSVKQLNNMKIDFIICVNYFTPKPLHIILKGNLYWVNYNIIRNNTIAQLCNTTFGHIRSSIQTLPPIRTCIRI
jgi:hypothetical protein